MMTTDRGAMNSDFASDSNEEIERSRRDRFLSERTGMDDIREVTDPSRNDDDRQVNTSVATSQVVTFEEMLNTLMKEWDQRQVESKERLIKRWKQNQTEGEERLMRILD